MTPGLYRGLTIALGPLIALYLTERRRRGKEDPERISERQGRASRPRPAGPLIWIHAASVGELTSALPLMRRLLDKNAELTILVTSGTVTSARLAADRLPPRAIHQFVPADRPDWVGRFLDHWRPDLALWVESELWPNLLGECRARGIATALVNARMSRRSQRRWQRLPGLIGPLLGGFVLCLAQDEEQAERLAALGAKAVEVSGSLKQAAEPLPAEDGELERLRSACAGRPLWLAASTHDGEEAIAARVHRAVVADHPGLLTIVAPRHPERGDELAASLAAGGLKVAQRSAGQEIEPATELYLADTLGELGLFYRLSEIVFVGGSLTPRGCQNLLEPARLGAAVIHGSDVENFRVAASDLAAAGASVMVRNAAELGREVALLLGDAALRDRRAAAGLGVTGMGGDGHVSVLDGVVAALTPWLPGRPEGSGENGHAGA
ncbi:MAG: 3-deoxy-D-manno-octulosonic acid transferase [Alphaproteobacteria bacterium]|jgi:3-deoxy-D-manno-octulosonic-acid transferase|nr:3-deoxy-D-manno-octulosonic acid transferase [Rhodospirillaceae bacterium]MDP6404437.1 3-deoxy-D-manno-octulosonic acid transferase [Alphaproteobacteria bacterium]MDP6623218.1 3-deoxy-D-manno-octulosonic acid transferase [Alphaproteobacteria bacterium]|tara:strand:- start:1271 stop:2584 length:1314 start_codon:yes stop_codon:yes gene_type:complete